METDFGEDPGVQAMLAWKAGDEGAFERLVVEYSPQVYALLTGFVGLRANREDLVQEVFLRVVRARERYEPTARFSTWLFRIVYHLSINETQRAGARERGAGQGEPDGRDDVLGEIGDPREERPDEGLERDDVVRAVRAAIAALPEQQRMALILAKYEELPYAEIAVVLGSSEKAVKSLVHRAREALRTSLAPFVQGLQGLQGLEEGTS